MHSACMSQDEGCVCVDTAAECMPSIDMIAQRNKRLFATLPSTCAYVHVPFVRTALGMAGTRQATSLQGQHAAGGLQEAGGDADWK